MRKQQLAPSPLSQIDDSLYFVDVDKISRVYVNEAEAKADGYGDCGEYRVYSQVPDPSPTCVRSEDAEKWIETLFGNSPGELYGIEQEDGTMEFYLGLEDAIQCQPDTERSTVEYVALCGEWFDYSEVENYSEVNLSSAAQSAYDDYQAKLEVKSASSKDKNRPAKAKSVK